MDDLDHSDPASEQYPIDRGQIGAIIQARLDNTKNADDHLWCHLGSICFMRQRGDAEPPVSGYRENGNGQRRRIDNDENLMVVTPDQTRKLGSDRGV